VRAVVVLPTFNERDNIEPFLRALRDVTTAVDVLVVDDNSPDGTADHARSVGRRLGGVGVVVRPERFGLGSAYRDGFARVLDQRYEVVVSMDADLSHDPAEIPAMLRLISEGADVVVGSRYVTGGGTTDWPVYRQLLSKWGNAYARFVLRLPTHDCTSGYRAYRASALRAIQPETTGAEGYAFLTELVRRLTRQGFRIEETPIIFRDRTRGTSKMSWRIVIESMLLVSRWGARDLVDRLTLRRRIEGVRTYFRRAR
jgi:dolichol-phosphate mannosyltransferase